MAGFFEERAGVPYPGDSYAQALVATSGGQELAGLSHMSEAYGRSVLADATATSLIAHELAHQWWGNLVTCREWTHFWLNEGFATFMAAAYKEHARGREAYLADVARLAAARRAASRRRHATSRWCSRTGTGRRQTTARSSIRRAHLALHAAARARWARRRSGAPFAPTRANSPGRPVTTADFQRAVERSSGRRLDRFFDEWAYLRQPAPAR